MKSLSKLIEQYGLMAVAVMVAVGFSGIFTYSSLVNTGSTHSGNNQQGPRMPSSNVQEGVSDLTLRERAFLGHQNNVAFVTVMEAENSSVELDAQSLVSDFNKRIYINFVEGPASPLAGQLGYTDFPRVVAVSGGAQNRRLAPRVQEANLTGESIKAASCNVIGNWGSLQSMCYSTTR